MQGQYLIVWNNKTIFHFCQGEEHGGDPGPFVKPPDCVAEILRDFLLEILSFEIFNFSLILIVDSVFTIYLIDKIVYDFVY